MRGRPRKYKRTWRSIGSEPDVSRTNGPGAEGHVNEGIGSLGKALQAAARASHSLTCGVPDRESNETKMRGGREVTSSEGRVVCVLQ